MRSLEIFNLKDKLEYLDEVAELEYDEWADNKEINKEKRIERKKKKICTMLTEKDFCKIILVDNDNLIGFISIFPKDCEEEKELTPWYSTMYVKKEYRHHGYSRVLNKAILKEAKSRKISVLYLKTNLENYYEKFGAIFIKNLKSGEHLYKFEV
jgi:N-acetylglutamate synthase-like GNAT family acetyltransferase